MIRKTSFIGLAALLFLAACSKPSTDPAADGPTDDQEDVARKDVVLPARFAPADDGRFEAPTRLGEIAGEAVTDAAQNRIHAGVLDVRRRTF